MSTIWKPTTNDVDLDPSIVDRLTDFARRRSRLITVRSFCAAVVALLLTMTLVAICDQIWMLGDPTRWLLSLVAYAATAATLVRVGWPDRGRQDLPKLARQFEFADGGWQEDLISAVGLADSQSTNGSPMFRRALQQRVQRRIANTSVDQLLPFDLVRPWLWTMAVALLVTGVLSIIPQIQFSRRLVRAMLPVLPIERASFTQIDIRSPSPPSGPVAAGDAVGVVAKIANLDEDRAVLEYQVADGAIVSSTMIRRTDDAQFAAIVPVNDQPVRYRLIAGDAITLWHRLMPIERPSAESFAIRYQFPKYARMDDQVIVQDDGRIAGVVGTTAHLTVGFTEACQEAVIRYFGRTQVFPMEPTDETMTEFSIALPIQKPVRYQIEAIGAQSQLRSPLVEPYELAAKVDGPPLVQVENAHTTRRLVSAIDSIPIIASIEDEFPIDKVFLEIQVNNGSTYRIEQQVPQAIRGSGSTTHTAGFQTTSRQSVDLEASASAERSQAIALSGSHLFASSSRLELELAVDLLDLRSNDGDAIVVAPGDIVQLQLVAIDRKGLRGDSTKQQWFVGDDGLDPNRYDSIQQLRTATEQVNAWSQALLTSLETAGEPIPNSEQVIDQLVTTIASTESRSAAGRLELIATGIATLSHLVQNRARNGGVTDQVRQRFANLARHLDQYARANLTHQLDLVLINDALAINQSIQHFASTKSSYSRQLRFLQIINQQLLEMDVLIDASAPSLLPAATKELQKWIDWRVSNAAEIAAISEPARDEDVSLSPLIDDLGRQMDAAKTGRSFAPYAAYRQLTRSHRELNRRLDSVEDIIRIGGEVLRRDVDVKSDSVQAVIGSIKQVHAAQLAVDLRYTADLGLLNRALDRLSDPRSEPIANESQSESLFKVADAFAILRVAHDLIQARSELRQLIDRERRHESTAEFWFDHPQRFSRYMIQVSDAETRLRNLSEQSPNMPATIHPNSSDLIDRVVDRLNERQNDVDRLVSLHHQMQRLTDETSEFITDLQPFADAARATLRRYAIPLSQTARLAAEKVAEAIDRVSSQTGDEQQSREAIWAADQATQRTIEDLMDLANSLTTGEQSNRELARDADSALSQISRQLGVVRETDQTSDSPQELTDELEDLRDRLAKTAEHFRRSEAGEDLAESRETLRAGEANAQVSKQLDDRAASDEAIQAAAEGDAEDLRDQLEREAEENEMMRDALSEIARKSAASALDSLKQSADDERELARQLEQSDATLAELKSRSTNEVAAIADQVATLDQVFVSALDKLLSTTNPTGRANHIAAAREAIQQAGEAGFQMNDTGGLQSDLDQTVRQMIQRIGQAIESVKLIQRESGSGLTDEQANQQRAQQQRQAERMLRDVRDQLVRAANDQKRDWTKAKQRASDRVARAEQRIRQQEQLDEGPQDEIDRASRHAALAQSAAETSVQHAKQMILDVSERAERLRNQSIDALDGENPQAETAQRLASQLRDQLKNVLDSLQQIQNQITSVTPTDVPRHVFSNLRKDQQIIRDEIDQTGNELRRVALNEQRLGRDEAAGRLADAASRIKRVASALADTAAEELGRGETETKDSARVAREKVMETESGIRAEVQQLSALLGQIDTENSAGRERPPQGAEAARAEQLAKTLDELDQARSQENSSESSQKAGDASPTLQEAADQASREAAKQRSEQIAADSQRPNQGESPQESAAESALSGSGSVGETDQRPISIDGIDREGSDWGKLQDRRGDDLVRTRRSGVPAKYRRQIDAYFRAIAEQAEGNSP